MSDTLTDIRYIVYLSRVSDTVCPTAQSGIALIYAAEY